MTMQAAVVTDFSRPLELPWLGSACGHCGYCVSGQEALCEQQANTGYTIDGGYAQYAVADGHYVVPVPDMITSLDAAPLTCAGVTTYKAVKVAGAGLDTKVGGFGVGGLGHLAVQYARLAGGFVTAVDIEDDKLELAIAASNESFRQAFASLRRGGRMVCVGLPAEGDLHVPVYDTVLGGKSVIGSIVGTRQDLVEVFDLHAAGRTRVITEGRELADINSVFEEILGGRVPARVVIQY
jgi:propanol-preferring alcohol dehydrogenase